NGGVVVRSDSANWIIRRTHSSRPSVTEVGCERGNRRGGGRVGRDRNQRGRAARRGHHARISPPLPCCRSRCVVHVLLAIPLCRPIRCSHWILGALSASPPRRAGSLRSGRPWYDNCNPVGGL